MQLSYVYMMSNIFRGTLYIGVTADLIRRVFEHKNGLTKGFTKRYKLHNFVYYEIHEDICEAIQRESRMKAWKRHWKVELIEKTIHNGRIYMHQFCKMDSSLRWNDGGSHA